MVVANFDCWVFLDTRTIISELGNSLPLVPYARRFTLPVCTLCGEITNIWGSAMNKEILEYRRGRSKRVERQAKRRDARNEPHKRCFSIVDPELA